MQEVSSPGALDLHRSHVFQDQRLHYSLGQGWGNGGDRRTDPGIEFLLAQRRPVSGPDSHSGSSFRTIVKTAKRTELIILITPHVIKTTERFQETSQQLKDSLRNVRKDVDQYNQTIAKDLEDAKQEREREEQKTK